MHSSIFLRRHSPAALAHDVTFSPERRFRTRQVSAAVGQQSWRELIVATYARALAEPTFPLPYFLS
jgi:hypothetical protein